MEIQIFLKIMEFILTLAVISPLFYARGRASFKHGGGVISDKCYVSIMLQKVLRSKRKKMKNEKKYDEKKRKVRKKEEERKKRKREK
jgi:hypothetical protein